MKCDRSSSSDKNTSGSVGKDLLVGEGDLFEGEVLLTLEDLSFELCEDSSSEPRVISFTLGEDLTEGNLESQDWGGGDSFGLSTGSEESRRKELGRFVDLFLEGLLVSERFSLLGEFN